MSHKVLWSGKTRNSTISVPGLKNYSFVFLEFSYNSLLCLCSTADGTHIVGAAADKDYNLYHVGGEITVTGDTVKVGGLNLASFDAHSISASVTWESGDVAYLTAIFIA